MTARQSWERLPPNRQRQIRLMTLAVFLPLLLLVVVAVDWELFLVLLIAWLVRDENVGALC